ncbi:MAG TPA: VOC family protein [Dehalococcoidia bacterium]
MQVNPYLNFDGQCAEAFRYYEQVLGGKVEAMMTFKDLPASEQVPAGWEDRVMHAHLSVGNQVLMGADTPPGQYQRPQGLYVSLQIEDAAQGERVFNALADGGTVVMPFQETFWAQGYGILVDRFGIPWTVNCPRAD